MTPDSEQVTVPDPLARLVWETDRTDRAAEFQEAAAFVPSRTCELSGCVGQLRVALADRWERTFSEPIPNQTLRECLTAPVPIGIVLDILQLNHAPTIDAVDQTLNRILITLQQQVQRLNRPRQLTLLTPDAVSRSSKIAGGSTAGQSVTCLQTLVEADVRFPTIYADPPWQYANTASRAAAENHYPTLSVDDICREPVRQLAAEHAHLHLWTTNAFLREAFEVIDAWGFEFKSCLVWVKPELGMGNYWRVSHEYLLLGVRGSLTFRERTQASWLLAQRTVHSRKPRAVRMLIEKVSPGPYLELYGRESFRDTAWTVYGNQIEEGLF